MKIYLIGRPTINEKDLNRFLHDETLNWRRTPSADESHYGEEIIELAGRICYMSFGDRQFTEPNSVYISNLVNMGHHSVLEHLNWSFLVTGVSRAFTHQLIRHRVGFSYSQLSQQYHDEDDNFIVPDVIRDNSAALIKWNRAMEENKRTYQDLMSILAEEMQKKQPNSSKKEISRLVHSAARSILPNAKETKIFVTANARALRNFLEVRGSIEGDYEMREFSTELLKVLHVESQVLFQDFEITNHLDGRTLVRKRKI